MLPESVHQKLQQLLNRNQEIINTINSESKNRPAKELEAFARREGWREDGRDGDHVMYSHDIYFDYPNYSGYITIDKGCPNLYARQVRQELEKIFYPRQKQMITSLVEDEEIRLILRKWLSYCSDQAKITDTQQLTNEIKSLKEQIYTYKQQLSSIEKPENSDADQEALNAILNENQKLLNQVAQKESDINELLDDLSKQQDELTASLDRISSLQSENSTLSAELTQLQEQQQHLKELEQELRDLQQQIRILQPFQEQAQNLQHQLTQAEIEYQQEIAVLNQRFQQVRQQLEQKIDSLNAEIEVKDTEITVLSQRKTQFQAQANELEQTLQQATLNQSQLARKLRRTQKPLLISSVIVAAVVALNPGPRLLNALAVAAIPTSTLAWQKRR